MLSGEKSRVNSKIVVRGAENFTEARPQAQSDNLVPLASERRTYMGGLISAAKGLEPPGFNEAPR